MYSLGLKLFATNTHLVEEARLILSHGIYTYIELYVPPDTYDSTVAFWQSLPYPFIIHAPHPGQGVNLADATRRKQNLCLISDAQRLADAVHAPYIIVHGGFGGPLEEVYTQLKPLNDGRFILENTPQYGTAGEHCTAFLPEHMAEALASGIFASIVIDIGHALYAANALSQPWQPFLAKCVDLQPALFHLSDGKSDSTTDIHMAIGQGDFDLPGILALLPSNARITLETPRKMAHTLQEAKANALDLRHYLPKARPSSP